MTSASALSALRSPDVHRRGARACREREPSGLEVEHERLEPRRAHAATQPCTTPRGRRRTRPPSSSTPAPASVAAWNPVVSTSPTKTARSSSTVAGTGSRFTSAHGTRTSSAWVPGRFPPNGPAPNTADRSHRFVSPRAQNQQLPHATANESTTRSPRRTVRTSSPTVLDDPDRLVAEHLAGRRGGLAVQEVQVRAADRRARHAHERIGPAPARSGRARRRPRPARARRTRPRAYQASSGNLVGTVPQTATSSCAACTYRRIFGRSPRTRSFPCIIARTGSSSPRSTSFHRR